MRKRRIRITIIVVLLTIAVSISSCVGLKGLNPEVNVPEVSTPPPSGTPSGTPPVSPSDSGTVTPSATPPVETATPKPPPPPPANLVDYNGIVEHIFFHPVIVYNDMAFDGDSQQAGLDEYMVTLSEYNKMLQSIYDNNYVLVNMNDVWSETTDANGKAVMKKNTLKIPEGKKPLIISYDDVNYYPYMLENGLTHKLIIGDDGELWSYGLDPHGKEVISQDLDAITILDKFVEEHPDFSLGGVKGCIALTGYEGILGYRTNTESTDKSAAFEANRQKEIELAKPIVQKLKDTGWYFASHSYGHIRLNSASLEKVKADAQRWQNEVGSLVGPTKLFIYPHGSRLDGGDVNQTGEAFKYYHSLGFRVFASVGIESFSKIKSDISAVVCDRMHSDGGTLRRERDRYLKFYDAKLVFDPERPNYGTKWS